MSETSIDVKVEQMDSAPAEKKHPNTCPDCGSHYRDDELEATAWVCAQCGHHFRMSARARIAWLADPGSFAATLDDHPFELAVMDFAFMGGSMGSAVGEKFVRACDEAISERTPLLLVTSSGGPWTRSAGTSGRSSTSTPSTATSSRPETRVPPAA